MAPEARIAAIVLAGGRASRLGQPKPWAIVGGEALLARVLRGVEGYRTAVVGPPELDRLVKPRDDIFVTRETPAFGGPVAGIAAGYAGLTATGPGTEWLILLACDLPHAAEAVSMLVERVPALADAEAGACLVVDDRPQWLCGIYRAAAVRSGLERLRRGKGVDSASVRSLLGALPLALIDGADRLAFDVDTPEDLRAANADERIDR